MIQQHRHVLLVVYVIRFILKKKKTTRLIHGSSLCKEIESRRPCYVCGKDCSLFSTTSAGCMFPRRDNAFVDALDRTTLCSQECALFFIEEAEHVSIGVSCNYINPFFDKMSSFFFYNVALCTRSIMAAKAALILFDLIGSKYRERLS